MCQRLTQPSAESTVEPAREVAMTRESLRSAVRSRTLTRASLVALLLPLSVLLQVAHPAVGRAACTETTKFVTSGHSSYGNRGVT